MTSVGALTVVLVGQEVWENILVSKGWTSFNESSVYCHTAIFRFIANAFASRQVRRRGEFFLKNLDGGTWSTFRSPSPI